MTESFVMKFNRYETGGLSMEILDPSGVSVFHTDITKEGVEELVACFQMENLVNFDIKMVIADE